MQVHELPLQVELAPQPGGQLPPQPSGPHVLPPQAGVQLHEASIDGRVAES